MLKARFNILRNLFRKHLSYLIIFGYSLLIFLLMVKINVFRYDDFGQGKFDLGNMTQMAWYSLRGKFMYLTDYFGSNVPRWSMSHVDPILVLFLPLFYLIPHPLTLVFGQNILVILGAFLVFEIAKLKTKNETFSVLLALSYLSYPALGFVLSLTGYHGVTPAIFFFLFFVYYYEKFLSEERHFKIKDLIILIVSMTLTMMGKEQISLYFIMFGIYAFVTSRHKKFAVGVSLYGLVWFIVCFFVIIPHYAVYRFNSFEHFVTEMGIKKDEVPNVYSANYFLARYSEFGESYSEIIKNMALNPIKVASIFVTGDKLDNLYLTFGPVGYLSFLYPLVLGLAFPDLFINYATSQGGVGTSEIYNHRISMIIPVVFISIAYGISFFQKFFRNFFYEKYIKYAVYLIGLFLFLNNVYFSLYVGQKNPLFAWFTESLSKKVFAKSDKQLIQKQISVGDSVEVSKYIENDRSCVRRIISMIPAGASVSGPDYMGSHLGQRETYAIFPAGKSTSEYLIVDIFSKKLLTILGLSWSLNRDFIESVFKSKDYTLKFSCSNLMVFKKNSVSTIDESELHISPIQKFENYNSKYIFEIYKNVTLVDTNFDSSVKSGDLFNITNVYLRKDSSGIADYNLFTTLINKETGDMYQFINYPSVVFKTVDEFKKDKFYEEKMQVRIPEYLEKGKYMLFVGMDNRVKTRSIYLGDLEIK